MNLTVGNVVAALLWALLASAATWLVTLPVRRRSLVGLLASVVLSGTVASAAAVLSGVHSMLLPMHDEATLIVVAATAGLGGTAAAAAAARRLTRDNASISAAIAQLARGQVPETDGRRLTAELERLRSELNTTARVLGESRERERALEASRRELVSWVSHDLRTPLAGLRAMSEALEDGVAGNPEQYYKQINASVERLSGMVDDLFDLSRIQAGSFARGVDQIPLDDLVSDCLAALEPLAAAQGVTLTGGVAHSVTGGSAADGPAYSAATSGSAAVTGNGPELNRALTNLVANAIRHTRANGVVDVCVRITHRDAHSEAEVVVDDECGGIPPQDLPRVFDVGYRGETARTPHATNPAGAGLGLAITRGIVEAHAGSVDVENTAAGCRFRVRLPVAS